MKLTTLVISALALLSACESGKDQLESLSNQKERNEIMQAIARDSVMSSEMFATMINDEQGMMKNHTNTMARMRKENPAMVTRIMSDMMEASRGDSAMMSGMVRMMMGNYEMHQMMQEGNNSGMMQGMDATKPRQ